MGHRRLALGTVQFGMAYGTANPAGQVPPAVAAAILADAAGRGVATLDTAQAYGEAETVLGSLPAARPFAIVTKTARLGEGGVAGVVAQARASLARLGRTQAQAILVHAAADLRGPDGPALWRALRDLQAEGLFRQVGISAYGGDDPEALAEVFAPDLMQLPVSLLDQRLVRDGTLARLASRGVEIHARSLFLQGLALMEPKTLPPVLARAAPALAERRGRTAQAGTDMLRACLHFALGRPEIARAVVGVTSLAQWQAIAAAAAEPAPVLDWGAFALEDRHLLDPAGW